MRDAIRAVVPAHQEPGQHPTELPYEDHGHQENRSYQTQLKFSETPQKKWSTGTGKKVQDWDFLGQPGLGKSKDTGKAESPNRTKVFVSMAMAAVF